jgi:hypothetical protein
LYAKGTKYPETNTLAGRDLRILPASPQYAIVKILLAGQEGTMDILSIVGAITGVLGLGLAIFVAVRQSRNDRLAFLSNVIFDTTIDRVSRQPFYDEYIAKKGNGTVVKFWLIEGRKEQAADSK